MLRAPFPYFGSKRHAAHLIWQALGDVASYCEPFCGSAAVLLARPGGAGRIETINDLSGHVANFWRAVRQAPDEVARHLDYPVIETDMFSRERWLVGRHPEMRARLDDDPDWCDPKAAGWWAWGAAASIGAWCVGEPTRRLPNLDFGKSVHGVAAIGRHADWCAQLAERIRRVRVTCGAWTRVVTPSALSERHAGERVGVFLDPPYAHDGRATGLYQDDDADVSAEVTRWAMQARDDHPEWRIVIAGYEGEREMPGWRVVAWNAGATAGSGGYGRKNGNPQRERLWLSPACLPVEGERGHQPTLFAEAAP